MQDILDVLVMTEKLKTTLRHSWTNDPKRQESVAEHSWMICLLAMLLKDKISIQIDLPKVLKMLVIHDLAEAITGDIPLGQQTGNFDRAAKVAAEREAIHKMFAPLDEATRTELLALWEEEAARETIDAKFAKAVDFIEACVQHWISDQETWDNQDYAVGIYQKDEPFEIDPFLKEFKKLIDEKTIQKIIAAGRIGRVAPEKLARYQATCSPTL